MSRWSWLAIIAIGCGHPTAPATQTMPAPAPVSVVPDAAVAPPALEDDLPRLADRAVKLYLDWQKAFDTAGTNCADATAKMNTLAEANADLIEANHRLMRSGHEKIKAARAELIKRSGEIDAAAQTIMTGPTMTACKADAPFNAALERLAGEG